MNTDSSGVTPNRAQNIWKISGSGLVMPTSEETRTPSSESRNGKRSHARGQVSLPQFVRPYMSTRAALRSARSSGEPVTGPRHISGKRAQNAWVTELRAEYFGEKELDL